MMRVTFIPFCLLSMIVTLVSQPSTARAQEVVSQTIEVANETVARLEKPLSIHEQLTLVGMIRDDRILRFKFVQRGVSGAAISFDGDDQCLALREHMRSMIHKRLAADLEAFSPANRDKVNAAIEVSINRFVREYRYSIDLLKTDLPNHQKEFDQLAAVGRNGLWTYDPLISQVIRGIQAESSR